MQSTEETRLKAIIKRRDTRIRGMKKIVNESANREYQLQQKYEELLQQQQDFRASLINYLRLDQYIRDVVRESM